MNDSQQASIDVLGVRTARCEALLQPLDERKPDQSAPGADGAANVTERSIGKNTTVNKRQLHR